MLFNSYLFIFLFLPITVMGCYSLGRIEKQYGITWLVICSLVFYGWWNPHYLFLIFSSIIVNFIIGSRLCLLQHKQRQAKITIFLGLVFNLALLGYFKYANFFVDNVNSVLGTQFQLDNIILPLAISFFTFQQIAYLVDCFKGLVKENRFIQYSLFVTFFPQLIAGPIVHHKEIMPQFAKERLFVFSSRHFSIGLSLFFLGLFKKVILADHLSLFASPVFLAAEQGIRLTFFEAWGGALAYTFQLYFDFSGYSDMAIGLAKLFGIRLPTNFNSPYKAGNIIEFWRRWHMTLSRFLKDYVYIPLGGNKLGEFKRARNLMITMLLGGIWHGAGWNFILWGGLHGIYLMINHQWQKWTRNYKWVNSRLYQFGAFGLTFVCVVFAWVWFRASNFSSALEIVKSMMGIYGISLPLAAKGLFNESYLQFIQFDGLFPNNLCHWPKAFVWLILSFMITWFLPNAVQIMRLEFLSPNWFRTNTLVLWKPNLVWVGFISLLAFASILHLGTLSEFLYFQF